MPRLTLALLVTRVLAADDMDDTTALDNAAVVAHPLDRCTDFHDSTSLFYLICRPDGVWLAWSFRILTCPELDVPP